MLDYKCHDFTKLFYRLRAATLHGKNWDMIKVKPLLAAALVFSSVTVCSIAARADSLTLNNSRETIYTKSDLPAGGEFVQHPKDKQVAYYLIGKWKLRQDKSNSTKLFGLYGSTEWKLRQDKSNGTKFSGLYTSTNAGQTWKLLPNHFNFRGLFIHPDTGELFAIINDNVIEPDKNGFLTVGLYDKAVSSKDGMHWKDIMGRLQRSQMLLNFFVDPEHPQRVRLVGQGFRLYILIAVDDNYSDWKRVEATMGPEF